MQKEKKASNQHRVTPQGVLDRVQGFMTIALDPAWNPYSSVEAEFVCDGIEIDGLAADWGATVAQATKIEGAPPPGVWLQPPWKDPRTWLEKVMAERAKYPELDILTWLPCYPETEASQLIWDNASRICFWGKREGHPAPPIDDRTGELLFGPKGSLLTLDAGQGSMWPTWLAYFGPRTMAFEKHFAADGNIVWGWYSQATAAAHK